MANQVSGRVIALSQKKTVVAATADKPAFEKQELYLDCTRYDQYTGERMQKENKLLLEFGGDKVLKRLEEARLQPGDIVTVSFELQGNETRDKQTGKLRVFNSVRCYDVEVKRRAGEMGAQTANPAPAAPAPQPAPQPQPQPQLQGGSDMFAENNDTALPF